jgi:flagellar motility protein MotE (MotC chaperone)
MLEARRAAAAKAAGVEQARKAEGWDFWTIEMENLVNELDEEKAQLRQRAAQLDQRAAQLDSERQELNRIRAQVEAMQAQIDSRVIAIGQDEMANLKKLAQMYSVIDPVDAVAIFRNMDDNEAVKILSLMKPDVTAPIFDAMTKPQPDGTNLAQRAATLSEKLRLVKSAGPSPVASAAGP